MNVVESEIKEMVERVIQRNEAPHLLEVCLDFVANLRKISSGGFFIVLLCDQEERGYGLCMEIDNMGSQYKVEFKCLDEAVSFFANEFFAMEHREIAEGTSMRLEEFEAQYIDRGYYLYFENQTVKH